jgi:hypothetical protein
MKFFVVLLFSLTLIAAAQPIQPAITNSTLDAAGVGKYLLSLQPKSPVASGFNLTVIAPVLPSAFTSSFDALTHGWCENPGFLSCNPSHFPIAVKILTSQAGQESFRVPATWRTLSLPLALSGNAAEVYVVKNNPAQAIWLVRNTDPNKEAILMGGLLSGTTSSAQLIAGPGIASAMYTQMLLDEIMARAVRWQP